MLAALVVAFILGALFSLIVAASAWLYTAPLVGRAKTEPAFTPTSLPEALREALSGGDEVVAVESCKWFNVIAAFLFQELRDTQRVKSFILAKIHKEFNELMFTRKEGRMLEQLTVRDYDLGSSLPVFTHAVVQQQKYSSNDAGELEELSISVHVDYSGGLWIGIDADLVFNRVAYVAIRVIKVKGHGQLQFTTQPCTHWSFAFYGEPELTLEVESTFEGRSFPQLSSFIEAQLRRWVKQRHTLPAHKTRYKPFFVKPQPQSQLNELYVHNERLTVGRLYVEVVKCSQLLHPSSAVSSFCTLNTSSLPWQPLLGVWHSRWAEHEFRVRVNDPTATVGICYRMVGCERREEGKNKLVMISEVLRGSPASHAGVKMGDIIVRVNNVKVQSVGQARKAIDKTKGSSVLLTVKRPPKHISGHMLSVSTTTHSATPTSRRTLDTASGCDVEGGKGGGERAGEVDSVGLCGVSGERTLQETSQSSDAVSLDDRLLSNEAAPPTLPPLSQSIMDVDEEGTMHQTADAEVCRSPRWLKTFKFNVGPHHHYLNVHVYDRLASEEKGELLIGHVTVPLMDMALECLASSSGRHHQKYVLVAPELTRATSSRAVQQASEGRGRGRGARRGEGEGGQQFVGSILLRFRYSTPHDTQRWEGEEGEGEEEERVDGEEVPVDCGAWQHQFQAQELEGARRCHICRKRIWALKGRVQVCVRCGVQSHKRCVAQCHRAVPCRHDILKLQSHEAQGFQIYEDAGREERDGGREVEGGEEEWVEHRRLRQQMSEEDFVNPLGSNTVEGGEGEEGEGEGDSDGCWETPAEPEIGASSGSDVSSEEQASSNDSGSESEDTLTTLLAHSMFSHLPEPERACALRNKVVELDAEVERAEQLVRGIQAQLNRGHGNTNSLRRQLRRHKDQLQPLQLMRKQYLRQMTSDPAGVMETDT